jgi:Trehalose utilization protein
MMKLLVISGDYYHPSEVIVSGLNLLKNVDSALDFTFTKEWDDFSKYDVVVLCKSDRVSESDEKTYMEGSFTKELLAYTKSGGGLLALHAGTVAPMTVEALKPLVGCSFDHHPEQCVVHYAPVGDSSLVRHVKAFDEKDEHYFVNMAISDADVFLSASSEAGIQPAGFSHQFGLGRVVVLVPGHNAAVFQNPNQQALLLNAIHYCAKDGKDNA